MTRRVSPVAHALILFMLVAGAPFPSSATPVELRSPMLRSSVPEAKISKNRPPTSLKKRPVKAEATLLSETFEGSWPSAPWSVTHEEDSADVVWARSTTRASEGDHSIWCAGGGADSPGPGGVVPPNSSSWAIVGPFDISDATSGSLSFKLWLKTEPFHDLFMWLASTDGENFFGEARSTDTPGWSQIKSDLTSWPNLGNLAGESRVWFAFVYSTDHNSNFEGAYLDEVTLIADSGEQSTISKTYTSDSDFDEGRSLGLETGSDAVKLSDSWSVHPWLWIANSEQGTVSKIDTSVANIGEELARYRTGPERDLNPSTIAVDLDGSCWIGNSEAGSVIKIALDDNGDCVDRNSNGVIDTSRDDDENGTIDGEELLDWGEDECVIWELVMVDGAERAYTPGEEHDDYSSTDLRALAVDADNAIWIGTSDSMMFFKIDGNSGTILPSVDVSTTETQPFDAIVDRNGILWSSAWPDPWLLRIDREQLTSSVVELDHGSSDLVISGQDQLFVSGYEDSMASRIDTTTSEVDAVFTTDWQSDGMAFDQNLNLWVASAGVNTVKVFNRNGTLRRSLSIGNGPTGIAVDGNGLIWVTGANNESIILIDPNTYTLQELSIADSGAHFGIGDMSGFSARNLTTKHGAWRAVFDSESDATAWGTLTWTTDEPGSSSILVEVRSSSDQITWSPWERAENGVDLSQTPSGRYLGIKVFFTTPSTDDLPTLKDLTVESAFLAAPEADFSWWPAIPSAGQEVQFTDDSGGAPTEWSWTFGDGDTASIADPSHSFGAAGTYTVALQVSNNSGSDSISKTILIQQGGTCTLDCSATSQASAPIGEDLQFQSSLTSSGCQGTPTVTWTFGDGTTSSLEDPTHSYDDSGIYEWFFTADVDGVSCTQSGRVNITPAGPEKCDFTAWIPVVSHAAGSFSSEWRSDVALLNLGEERAAVEFRFHDLSTVNTAVIDVQPLENLEIIDIVDLMAPGEQISGALEICSDHDLVVTSRTYNQLSASDPSMPGGTFGQRLEGSTLDQALSAGDQAVLPQLRESASFRSNIGFVNCGGEDATVVVTLLDEAGLQLAEFDLTIAPGQWYQEGSPLTGRTGEDEVKSGWARVSVISGEAILAYASVIDNTTNDPSTVVMRP